MLGENHGARETGAQPEIRISPGSGWYPRMNDLWGFREVLYFLAWRDLRVRYKQTAIGMTWTVLQPLLTMAVLALVFGRLAKMPSEGVPYPLFALCGLVPWQLFASGLTTAANSLVTNERLLTKVYFPRIMLPTAALMVGVVDFFVALALLLCLMGWYGQWPGAKVLLLPFFLALCLATALAVGVGFSALSVRYRDVRHALPFVTQLWLIATPIVYPSSLFPARWRPFLGFNPMSGVVEGFRWSLLGTTQPSVGLLGLSAVIAVAALTTATAFFVHIERTMADEI